MTNSDLIKKRFRIVTAFPEGYAVQSKLHDDAVWVREKYQNGGPFGISIDWHLTQEDARIHLDRIYKEHTFAIQYAKKKAAFVETVIEERP